MDVVLPHVFHRFGPFYHAIFNLVIPAVYEGDNSVVEDILKHVPQIPLTSDRVSILSDVLDAAARVADGPMIRYILSFKHSIVSLASALYLVYNHDEVDVASLLVSKFMDLLPAHGIRNTSLRALNDPHTASEQQTMMVGNEIMMNGMYIALTNGSLEMCATVLPAYLKTLSYYYDQGASPSATVLAHVPPALWAMFSRTQCLSMLSSPVPPNVMYQLLRRLRVSGPTDMKITTGGEVFSAHRDVLALFCSYFAALFRGPWLDRDHVNFGLNISGPTMKALLDYLYCGSWDDMRLDNLDVDREELFDAADYLGFDNLISYIEEIGFSVSESQNEPWYSTDEEACFYSDEKDYSDMDLYIHDD
ncbi:hypothetical protein BJX64DRAFT_285799 [Aspergillus heterothallicus]